MPPPLFCRAVVAAAPLLGCEPVAAPVKVPVAPDEQDYTDPDPERMTRQLCEHAQKCEQVAAGPEALDGCTQTSRRSWQNESAPCEGKFFELGRCFKRLSCAEQAHLLDTDEAAAPCRAEGNQVEAARQTSVF